uniref:Protein artemis n=1 Tax=Mesocestoides corti TaxID=53468 RepID=A0A5K3FDX9_MESCO
MQYGLIVSGSIRDEECVFLLLESTEKNSAVTNLDGINTEDLRIECQRICRMLPTGARVSGIYFCGSVNAKELGSRVKELLHVIYRAEKHHLTDNFIPLPEREKVFLHVDPLSKKLLAKTIGFTQAKDFLRPIDVKVRPVVDRWRSIKTYTTLSVETNLPPERQKEKIFDELQDAVRPFLQAVHERTRLLVNGDMKSDTDPLFSGRSQRAAVKAPRHSRRHKDAYSTKSVKQDSSEEAHHAAHWDPSTFTLFGPDFPCWPRTNSCSSIDSGHGSEAFPTPTDSPLPEGTKNLIIHGRIPGLAFLPVDGTTVSDALKAFRRDLIHSVLLRLELLTEELHITSGELEVSRILLPQRVLIHIPACPAIPLSDYKFVSETPDDVVRRVAMFCRPLGSPTIVERGGSAGDDRVSTADSGEFSSDSDFNVDSGEEAGGRRGSTATEPAFNASCLDTCLERTFEGNRWQ